MELMDLPSELLFIILDKVDQFDLPFTRLISTQFYNLQNYLKRLCEENDNALVSSLSRFIYTRDNLGLKKLSQGAFIYVLQYELFDVLNEILIPEESMREHYISYWPYVRRFFNESSYDMKMLLILHGYNFDIDIVRYCAGEYLNLKMLDFFLSYNYRERMEEWIKEKKLDPTLLDRMCKRFQFDHQTQHTPNLYYNAITHGSCDSYRLLHEKGVPLPKSVEEIFEYVIKNHHNEIAWTMLESHPQLLESKKAFVGLCVKQNAIDILRLLERKTENLSKE
jgi:hypothetical protein